MKISSLNKVTVTSVSIIFYLSLSHAHAAERCDSKDKVLTTSYGAMGDGKNDDTKGFQMALSFCSEYNKTCVIPRKANHLIKSELFIYGDMCLIGEDVSSAISFDIDAIPHPYLLNTGIWGPSGGNSENNRIKKEFSGVIENVTFNITESDPSQLNTEMGRIIYFWRTRGALIESNRFNVGSYSYSATSSGNDTMWLSGVGNYIRENITIINNTVKANHLGKDGSEGIGLGRFNGAIITGNKIDGVADDPIGVHWSNGVFITNNEMTSIDGRIYVSNSKDVTIANNIHTRVSTRNGIFYEGIALIYVGFEIIDLIKYPYHNHDSAPTDIRIFYNTLIYSEGAIDAGSAIYLRSLRNGSVEYNYIQNNSQTLSPNAMSIYIAPQQFIGIWDDPDTTDDVRADNENSIARFYDVIIRGNTSIGALPLPMKMTGDCVFYADPVINVKITGNVAPSYSFYCGIPLVAIHTVSKPLAC